MKKQSFLVMVVASFLIMIIFSLTTNSYGQFSDPDNNIFSKNQVFIFVQTLVENSDDQLVNEKIIIIRNDATTITRTDWFFILN